MAQQVEMNKSHEEEFLEIPEECDCHESDMNPETGVVDTFECNKCLLEYMCVCPHSCWCDICVYNQDRCEWAQQTSSISCIYCRTRIMLENKQRSKKLEEIVQLIATLREREESITKHLDGSIKKSENP